MTKPLVFRRALPADATRLQAIRAAAFAPVFASFRSILGDEIYDIAQRRDDEGHDAVLASLMSDPSHAPARRAYEKAGFDVRIPSVWMYRKL